MLPETITSAHNPRIKSLIELGTRSRERRSQGLFVVEGIKEIEHCIEGGYDLETIYLCVELLDQRRLDWLCGLGRQQIAVSRDVYAKIAYRESTEGVVATVHTRQRRLDELNLPDNALVIVLESVEKPGNLGAVLRTADACGVDAVLVCDPLTDLFNPNVIRASLGGVFTSKVVACTSEDAIRYLKDNKISIYTAQLQDSDLYYDVDFCGPSAIVMGTEHDGLSYLWRKAADAHIRIPMLGRLDSLNVSVSTAVLCYEAVRQRQGSQSGR